MSQWSNQPFILKTTSSHYEVSYFSIMHWGISQEYTVDLKLPLADIDLQLGEACCLEVDGRYFHGSLFSKQRYYSDQIYECSLRLVSPLTRALNEVLTRIYSDQSIKAIIQTLLQQAGWVEGVHFELQLDSLTDRLWCHQNNERSLDFFKRLLKMYGLSYAYQSTSDNALCVISQSLDPFLSSEIMALPMDDFGGFQQTKAVHRLEAQAQLSPKKTICKVYHPAQSMVEEQQHTSSISYALGEQVVAFHQPHLMAESLQKAKDELADKIQLETSMIVNPGQEISLDYASHYQENYWVRGVNIEGNHQCPRRNAPISHAHRIKATINLVRYLSGYPKSELSRPASAFHLATIEHREGDYPALSEQGSYRLRLHQDEILNDASHAKSKASHWVRCALYYAGNGYGLGLPFHDGSQVVVGYENGNAHLPLILGGIFNAQNRSVVTKSNHQDHIFRSATGSEFLIREANQETTLHITASRHENRLNLYQNQNQALFSLTSLQGSVTLDANEVIAFKCEKQWFQYSKLAQNFWIKGKTLLESKEAHLSMQSTANISIHGLDECKMDAKNEVFSAKNRICFQANELFELTAQNCMTFITHNGNQLWQSINGSIYFKANQSISIKQGPSSINFTQTGISLITPSTICLNSPAITGI